MEATRRMEFQGLSQGRYTGAFLLRMRRKGASDNWKPIEGSIQCNVIAHACLDQKMTTVKFRGVADMTHQNPSRVTPMTRHLPNP